MIKNCLILGLCCLLLAATNAPFVSAQTNTGNSAASIATIKTDVAKIGTGEKSRIEVKTLDGKKRKGYINQAGEDSFTLIASNSAQPVSIAYSDVAQIKKAGSKGKTIALWIIGGAAIIGGIVLGNLLLTRCRNEGGC